MQSYAGSLLRLVLFYSILLNNQLVLCSLQSWFSRHLYVYNFLFFCRCTSGPGERGETEVQTEVGRREQRLPRPHHPPSSQKAM